ncbi:MAG TPA: DUF4173 domain-containing protein [Pyrinomonadaceae bacterium]|nr:DUF4173 domain-containing protein [Pyrinomonadaceae bacterium]
MNERTKTALEILQVSALIGILGNLLLRQTPWGLNALLFVTVFVAGLLMLLRKRRPALITLNTIALCGAMVFFSSMFVLRDSIELRVYDTFAIFVIMGVILLVNLNVKANVAGVFHYAVGFIWSGLTSTLGAFMLLGSDIDWKAMPGNKISKHVFAVLRGIAIALPLLLIFGALFMAADAVFEGWVNRAINFDLEKIVSHVMITSVFAWLTAGYFRGAMASPIFPAAAASASTVPSVTIVPNEEPSKNTEAAVEEKKDATSFVAKVAAEPGEEPATLPNSATVVEHINRSDPPHSKTEEPKEGAAPNPDPKKRNWPNFDNSVMPSGFTLGTIETVIILGLVDLLFISFVAIQVPYLFGGMDLVQNTPDFKLAEYARRGFGELVVVAALVLPMLLASHWLLRRGSGGLEKLFRVLAGLQIALLFVIMASAVQRLLLLTGELGYGMTTVRFYPMVVMTWLAVVFIWFLLTVFRGARKHFAWGALWSAIVILGVTNLINPDKLIVQTNLKLMHQGRQFDGDYNAHLSADSIPTILEALPYMSPEDQCDVKFALDNHRLNHFNGDGDLRSFSFSRSSALSDLEANSAAIRNTDGCVEAGKLLLSD